MGVSSRENGFKVVSATLSAYVWIAAESILNAFASAPNLLYVKARVYAETYSKLMFEAPVVWPNETIF